MKLIDEKGKLFGLINIVDLLVLAAVLLVLGGAYYKFKGGGSPGEGAAKTVRATVIATAIRPEMLQDIKVGDKMVSGSSFTNVEIKDIKIKPALIITTDSAGRRVEATDPYLKDIIVTVEGKTVVSGASVYLGNQEMRANKDYYIKSLNYEYKGIIQRVEIE